MASPASDTSSLAATQRHTSSHTPDRGKPAALHAPVATSASPENGVSEAKRGEPATLEPKSGSSGSDDARATAKGETSPPKAKPTPENTSINKEEDTGESVGHGKTNHRHKRPSSAHKSTAVPLFDASGAQLSGDSTDDEEPSGVADNKSSKSDPVAHQGHTRSTRSSSSIFYLKNITKPPFYFFFSTLILQRPNLSRLLPEYIHLRSPLTIRCASKARRGEIAETLIVARNERMGGPLDLNRKRTRDPSVETKVSTMARRGTYFFVSMIQRALTSSQ